MPLRMNRLQPQAPGAAGPRLVGWAATVLLGFCLAGCRYELLDPAGPVAAGEKLILLDALTVMLAIIVPVIIATLAFAWWYRAANPRARRLPDWSYSGRIELVVWSIPVLVVVFLGGMAWVSSHELDPGEPLESQGKPLNVQVVSLDWKWLFIYPDQGVASVNRLVIPAGAPVRFQLTSGSVMTAFFIPRLGSMIYTMNGMVSPLNLMADKPGDYFGEAAHYSGDGFSDMNFTASALSASDFAAWVAGVRGRGPLLDAKSYEVLARQSARAPSFTYGQVQPGLFQAIATQRLPPGPGPAGGPPARPNPGG
ncbi:MAG: ubiquinol oxidase subunit II [Caulobacteraceae bacterium]|nr:ubiquinol oxidase subunit II [Caulobacteraceae bacterium]